MKRLRLISVTCLAVVCLVSSAIALDDYPRIPNLKSVDVAVLADSISCSRLARYIMRSNKKTETSLREADVILAVVRSSLNTPLDDDYDSVGELKEDVESQFNISGSNGHIYVYQINSDRSVEEIFHSGFEWKDSIEDL